MKPPATVIGPEPTYVVTVSLSEPQVQAEPADFRMSPAGHDVRPKVVPLSVSGPAAEYVVLVSASAAQVQVEPLYLRICPLAHGLTLIVVPATVMPAPPV